MSFYCLLAARVGRETYTLIFKNIFFILLTLFWLFLTLPSTQTIKVIKRYYFNENLSWIERIEPRPKWWIIAVRPTKHDKPITTMIIHEGGEEGKRIISTSEPRSYPFLIRTTSKPDPCTPPQSWLYLKEKRLVRMRKWGKWDFWLILDEDAERRINTEKDIVDERERERTSGAYLHEYSKR